MVFQVIFVVLLLGVEVCGVARLSDALNQPTMVDEDQNDECLPPNNLKPGQAMPEQFKSLFKLGPHDDVVFDYCGNWFIDMQHNYAGFPVYDHFGAEWFRAVFDKKQEKWWPHFPSRAHLKIDQLPNAEEVRTQKPSKQLSVDACRRHLNISSKLPVANVNRYVLVYDETDVTRPKAGSFNPVIADHVLIWKFIPSSHHRMASKKPKKHHGAYPWYSCFYDTFASEIIPWQ